MKYFPPSRRTIASDLSGILFIAIILVVAVIGLSLDYLLAERFEKELNALATDLTSNLADRVGKPLAENDLPKASQIAREALTFSVLKGVRIVDNRGTVIFSMQKENSPQRVEFDKPIYNNGRSLGKLYATFSKDVRSRVRNAIALFMVGAIIILSTVILLTTMLVLKLRLLKQLKAIKDGITKIAAGDYDVRLSSMPLAEPDSIARGVNEMSRQISERTENLEAQIKARKEAVNLLTESEQRYQAMLEATPDPVIIVDGAGEVLYFNPAFTEIFGWDLDECRSQATVRLFPDSCPMAINNLIERLEGGETVSGHETTAPRKNGAPIPVMVSAAAYRDQEGRIMGFVVSLRDQRVKKTMEDKLLQAQKMHAIGILAAGIAHDMNNLFMGIQGYTSLMQLSTDKNSQSWERLKKIEQCVAAGATLTRQLLGMARGGKYEVKTLDLNKLLKEQGAFFGRSRKEASITADYCHDLWSVEADRSQLELVVLNLLTNAWQSMGESGTITVSTRNEEFLEGGMMPLEAKPGKYVVMSVSDSGEGMDEDTRLRIFEPFFTSRDMGHGTGLGLWSTYGIVKAHDGFITVDSALGRGSTFSVFLPATRKKTSQAGRQGELGLVRGTGTILLVDDEEMVLSVGKEMLETLGYTVIAVGRGMEAVEIAMARGAEIDLMVLDMIMPEMSGAETYAAVKAAVPGMRVLLASGYSRDGQAQEILDKGCDGFIQKPFTIEALAGKVAEILNN